MRSEKFIAQRGESSVLGTKAKVLNKIVREVSGVHTYTLVPPILPKTQKKKKELVDPDTHPLMKPYRDESTRNPIMCSFGHRPRSASRTFHPSTMNVRLQHGEVAAVAGMGKNGFGLQPAVLAKLLHAPSLTSSTLEDEETAPKAPLEDPHNLFLPTEELFDQSAVSNMQTPLGKGGNLEHSKSWNASSFSAQEEGDFNATSSFNNNRNTKNSRRSRNPNNSTLSSVGKPLVCAPGKSSLS